MDYKEYWKQELMEIKEFTEPLIKSLSTEINFLLREYQWKWNKEDLCYYNEYNEDVCDCVYYSDDYCFLCHPKLLATYVEEWLDSKREYQKKVKK